MKESSNKRSLKYAYHSSTEILHSVFFDGRERLMSDDISLGLLLTLMRFVFGRAEKVAVYYENTPLTNYVLPYIL
jgi:hypothetical protein